MKTYDQMTALFESADTYFREQDKALFWSQVSERTLCGALMLHLHDIISMDNTFAGYHVDVEYNRNKGNIKTIQKEISDNQREIIPINCDLIVHSRGECIQQDNLIAIEMKKSHRTRKEKDNDRARLVALTKDDGFDDCRRKLALPGKGTQFDGLCMGRRRKRKPDCRSEILLLQLTQIAELDCWPQSNAAFIHHGKEVRDEFCETDIALYLRVAVRCIFCNYLSC